MWLYLAMPLAAGDTGELPKLFSALFSSSGIRGIKEISLSVLLTVVGPLSGTWEQSKFSSLINNDAPFLAMKSCYHPLLIVF